MRVAVSLIATLCLIVLVGASATAQQEDTLWQRMKGLFTRKSNDTALKTERRPLGNDAKLSELTGPRETRGLVYLDEAKPAPAPKAPLRPVPIKTAAVKQASAPANPAPIKQASAPANPAPIKQASAPASPAALRPTSVPSSTAVKQSPAVAAPSKRVAPAAKDDLLVHGLTRQVSEKCPQARNVKVTFTGEKEITVEMEVRNQDEANTLVEHVFAIRDLDAYRVNVKFSVPQQ